MSNIKNKIKKDKRVQLILKNTNQEGIDISADTFEKVYEDEFGRIQEDENGESILPEGKSWRRDGFYAVDVSAHWNPNFNEKKIQEKLFEDLKDWLKEDFDEKIHEDQCQELQRISDKLKKIDHKNLIDVVEEIERRKKKYKNKKEEAEEHWKDRKDVLLSDLNKNFSDELKNILKNLKVENDLEWYVWEVCPIKKTWTNWIWVVDNFYSVKTEMAEKIVSPQKRDLYAQAIKSITDTEVIEKIKNDGYEKFGKIWVSNQDPTLIISEVENDLPDGYSKKRLAAIVSLWMEKVASSKLKVKYQEK